MVIPEKMETVSRQIALKDIDDSPGPYCMSFGVDLEPLARSIREIGLVNPPILKREREGLTVVTGYRRIMALKELKAETAASRIISGRDNLRPLECLLLNLHDNLATRHLNDVEKGMVLSRLEAWVPTKELVERYMPLLGLRSREEDLHFLIEMEREFDTPVKTFISEGRLSWQAVKMLSRIDAASRSAILKWISKLRLNINQQSQFIDYLVDLSFIENKSIPHILGEKGLNGPSPDTPVNRPQQAKAVLNTLKARRNPLIVRAEKQFKKTISDLNLPDGIQISAPPFFEGENYRMEVIFRGGEDLKIKLEGLNRIQGLGTLGHPWREDPE
ncbi:MAG: ParB N-terminal domain-containing protein [Deltaproteobacteria bacterium]|nr:ParB N-terminal domain-containing protein [Deltaproteobacteria bacterium]